jgi:Ser-tRNA(Ala) deacylase AlaX
MPGTYNVNSLKNGPLRVVCVGGPTGCPCGGTHLSNTKEITNMIITKIKKVKK